MDKNYTHLIVSAEERICKITINREAKLNALNHQMLNELHLAIKSAINTSEISGIIITGAGEKAFVAGADIAEFAEFTPEEGKRLATEAHKQVFDLISNAEKPIIAAINGFALGGGLELALACHLRIAASHAKLGQPEVSIGLIPGYGGTQRLTALVGRSQAFEIILTGDMITAEKALAIGLVNHVVEPQLLMQKAEEILSIISSRSQKAVAAAIRAINASQTSRGFETEIDEFSKLFGTPEFQEGVGAFLEKRKPNF